MLLCNVHFHDLLVADDMDNIETLPWKCDRHLGVDQSILRHREPHVVRVGVVCLLRIWTHVKKVLITYPIHHHIVCDVSFVVYSASATAYAWIQEDCLCSAWNDAWNTVWQYSYCIQVASSDLSLTNWCPRHWKCMKKINNSLFIIII